MTSEQLVRVVNHVEDLIYIMADREGLRVEVDKAMLRLDVIKHWAIRRSIMDILDAPQARVE